MESSSNFNIKLLSPTEIKKLTKVTNINLGIMGHIDSGKTSICSSLTSIASTASLDKNPQSKEKGITIDLGFSSFAVEMQSDFKLGDSNFGSFSLKINSKKKPFSLLWWTVQGILLSSSQSSPEHRPST